MKAARRFTDHKKVGHPLRLDSVHKAVISKTTLFPKRIATPDEAIPLFKSGQHSRKIGSHVTKGMWKGMPIYTLTLEERATCPIACEHWHDCFGNKMHWSTRWRAGIELETQIPIQIATLAKKHKKGFVVRLHVLGDFYSIPYVQMWETLMKEVPQLHVFGYTRRRNIASGITEVKVRLMRGEAMELVGYFINYLNEKYPTRWRIRWSELGGEMGTLSKDDVTLRGKTPDGIVCPAQTGGSDCCGTCGLCWNTTKPIVFITH